MSEHQSEPTNGAAGTGLVAPETSAPVTATAVDQDAIMPTTDATKAEPLQVEAPKIEKPDHADAKADIARTPGKLLIMSPAERSWDRIETEAAPGTAAVDADAAPAGKRRFAAMAAVVALATVAGALGGALGTAGFAHVGGNAGIATARKSETEAAITRIESDLVALKASVDQTARTAAGQFNKTSDRLDKVEKAQAEPAARLAKLTEAVDKLRTAQAAPSVAAVSAAPAAAKDVTGTVSAPTTTAAAVPIPVPSPKPEIGRLPTVQDWVLRDVSKGAALIEGRGGIYEVYAGDPVPGLGRVDAIRKQDGRWVVVTSRGLIVAR